MKGLLGFLRRVPGIAKLVREIRTWSLIGYFRVLNLYGQTLVTEAAGPVVSLTTHGARSGEVYLAIESISRGSRLPSRLILWLDDPVLFGDLPFPLHRLMKRGLEVKLCKNYGPHTKYYPYLESEKEFAASLVTADDDILYPRKWLQELIETSNQIPSAVVCHRAHIVGLCGGRIDTYTAWKPCETTAPNLRHFATGVSGVLYPPEFLKKLKQASTDFEKCCPKADDVWLHVQAIRAGFRICQIKKKPIHFLMIPETQAVALTTGNCVGGGNDRQIAATYTAEDIQILLIQKGELTCKCNPIHVAASPQWLLENNRTSRWQND